MILLLMLTTGTSVVLVSHPAPLGLGSSVVIGLFLIWFSHRRLTHPLKANGGGSE
jgi:hypothetical protein